MGKLVYIGLDELPKVDKMTNRVFLSRSFFKPYKVLKLQALHVLDDSTVTWDDITSTEPEVPVYEASKNEEDPPWLCIINTATFVWQHAYKDGFNRIWLLHKYLSDEHPSIFGAIRGIVEQDDEDEGTT